MINNDELQQRIALPLEEKVKLTRLRIRQWVEYWDAKSWEDNKEYMPYVSFSGGKDSTVLAHIARSMYPDIPLVFLDTGLEFPEIRAFVKSFIKNDEQSQRIKVKKSWCDVYEKSNLYIVYPVKTFKQVIEEDGYPVISKEVAGCVAGAKVGNVRWKRLQGTLTYGDGQRSAFNHEKWKFLLDAPFRVSDKCCNYLKKSPAKYFEKIFNGVPIIATMTEESRMRKMKYLKEGCNAFHSNRPKSQPISFWTQQDILTYLKMYKVPYASIYGDIVESEMGELQTTGEKRTGCMFCMFGVHLEKGENRFQRMHRTHPRQWDACINKMGCGKVLDYIGVKY